MSKPRAFRLFERAITRVSKGTLSAGEEGEVTRVYADGSLELEVRDRPWGVPTFVILGVLADKPPFARRRSARFTPAELRRPNEG